MTRAATADVEHDGSDRQSAFSVAQPQIATLLAEYPDWQGSLSGFCRYARSELGLPFGRGFITTCCRQRDFIRPNLATVGAIVSATEDARAVVDAVHGRAVHGAGTGADGRNIRQSVLQQRTRGRASVSCFELLHAAPGRTPVGQCPR